MAAWPLIILPQRDRRSRGTRGRCSRRRRAKALKAAWCRPRPRSRSTATPSIHCSANTPPKMTRLYAESARPPGVKGRPVPRGLASAMTKAGRRTATHACRRRAQRRDGPHDDDQGTPRAISAWRSSPCGQPRHEHTLPQTFMSAAWRRSARTAPAPPGRVSSRHTRDNHGPTHSVRSAIEAAVVEEPKASGEESCGGKHRGGRRMTVAAGRGFALSARRRHDREWIAPIAAARDADTTQKMPRQPSCGSSHCTGSVDATMPSEPSSSASTMRRASGARSVKRRRKKSSSHQARAYAHADQTGGGHMAKLVARANSPHLITVTPRHATSTRLAPNWSERVAERQLRARKAQEGAARQQTEVCARIQVVTLNTGASVRDDCAHQRRGRSTNASR